MARIGNLKKETIQREEEEINLSVFTDYKILYIVNTKEYEKKH